MFRQFALGLLMTFVPAVAVQAAPAQSVTVINPPTSPVNARITNSVVPVQVSNADPIPVAVQVAPVAPEEIVRLETFKSSGIPMCFSTEFSTGGYTVPNGKIFVVEQVSVYSTGTTSSPAQIRSVRLFASFMSSSHFIPIAAQVQYPGGDFIVSQQVTYYARAGEVIDLEVVPISGGTPHCGIVGRLIDAS